MYFTNILILKYFKNIIITFTCIYIIVIISQNNIYNKYYNENIINKILIHDLIIKKILENHYYNNNNNNYIIDCLNNLKKCLPICSHLLDIDTLLNIDYEKLTVSFNWYNKYIMIYSNIFNLLDNNNYNNIKQSPIYNFITNHICYDMNNNITCNLINKSNYNYNEYAIAIIKNIGILAISPKKFA